MARLKGRVWEGEDATEYLFTRLMGEDGEPAWTLAEAAKAVSKKLKVKVGETTVSKWRKGQERQRKEAEDYDALIESTTNQLAKHAESGIDLDQVVDAQILIMIAQVRAESGIEEAIKFINSLTALKRAMTSDREQKQGVREYEESVEKLKARVALLSRELKLRGFDPAALDELNKRTVEEIDATIRANRPK